MTIQKFRKAVCFVLCFLMCFTSLTFQPTTVEAASETETINLEYFANEKAVFDKIGQKCAVSSDYKYLYIASKANQASSNSSIRYATVGWHIDIINENSGKSYTLKIADGTSQGASSTYITNTKKFGDAMLLDGYYYSVRQIKQQDIKNMLEKNGKESLVESNYTLKLYPILTTRNAGSDAYNCTLKSNSDGTVEVATGSIAYMYDMASASDRARFLNVASWSSRTVDTINNWESGWDADFKPVTCKVYYAISFAVEIDNAKLSFDYSATDLAKQNGDTTIKGAQAVELKNKAFYYEKNGNQVVQIAGTLYETTAATFSGQIVGYTAKGWNTKADGTGTSYNFGEELDVSKRTVLYLMLEPTVETDYYKSGVSNAEGNVPSKTRYYQDYLKLPNANLYTMVGKVAIGWSTQKNASYKDFYEAKENGIINTFESGFFTNGAKYGNREGTTFYAVWEPEEYTISLEKNGGTNGSNKYYETYNEKYSDVSKGENVTSISIPTLEGYNFEGYYTSQMGNGSEAVTENGSLVKNIASKGNYKFFTSDDTVYALYSPKQSTLTLDNNGGSGGSKSTTVTYDEIITNGLTAPTRVGYSFYGYSSDGTLNGEIYYDASMSSSKVCKWYNDKTIKAIWIDDIKPQITVIADSSGNWIGTNSGTSSTFKLNIMDQGSGIKDVKVYLNGSSTACFSQTFTADECAKGKNIKGFDTNSIKITQNGILTFKIVARDNKGNEQTTKWIAKVDLIAPHMVYEYSDSTLTKTNGNLTYKKTFSSTSDAVTISGKSDDFIKFTASGTIQLNKVIVTDYN